MKKDSLKVFKSKFVAVLVLLSQFTYLLPAQTYLSELNYDKQKLERYLDRASRERNAQDWERIAEEGIFIAMCEWESANTYLKETDYDKYLEEYQNALNEINETVNNKFAYWYTEKTVSESTNIHKSTLYYLLENKAYEYKEQYKANGASLDKAEETRKSWEEYAQGIIDYYLTDVAAQNDLLFPEIKNDLTELNLTDEQMQSIFASISSDYNTWAASEYENVYKAERNQLTAVLLYDTQSTKKLNATQAAEAIARETAQKVKAETDASINKLFNEFESEIDQIDGEEIIIAQNNWLNNFQKVFDESLQKWNNAEKEFLVKRSEWEYQAEELYAENEAAWAEGYRLLQEKKDEWFKDINEKLEKGRLEWNKSEELLTKQLDAAKLEMQATYEKERDTKSKLLDVEIGLYEQSRTMLNIAAQGLTGFAESFEKYKNRYSYWKTEDNENIKTKIDELFDTIKTFKNKPGDIFNLSEKEIQSKKSLITELAACCQNESLKSDLESLIEKDGWIDYLITYKAKAKESIEKLYLLTGCVYNETKEGEITFLNELDIQILKSKATLDYWNEEYEVALAVKEYAESHSSETETDTKTIENLNKAIAEYEAALSTYNSTVSELAGLLNTVDEKQTGINGVDKKTEAMNKEKAALDKIQEEYSQLLVVFRGASTDTLIQKIANLIKEYDEIKNIDNTNDFNDYYDALVQYNTEVLKTNLYTVQNNLNNGKTVEVGSNNISADTKSIEDLTTYKTQIQEFITNGINYNSQSDVTSLRTKVAGMQYYAYDQVNNIISILDLLEANKETYSEVQKKQLQENINQNLKMILQYWQNEIDFRNGALDYIKNGTISNQQSELTPEQIDELTVRNYLKAVLDGTKKWEKDFGVDFSKYEDLFKVINELLNTNSSSFLNKCKEKCETSPALQYLLKQQDIFESSTLMNWIFTETEYQTKNVLNKIQNQNDIKEFYSQYIVNKVQIKHYETINEVQKYINKYNYTNMSLDQIYDYVNELSKLSEGLNIHGQASLNNYITGVLDYAGTKYAFTNNKTEQNIKNEIETVNNQFKEVNKRLNDLNSMSYSISDIVSVLGLIKNNDEIYKQNKDDFIEYATYLVMSKLFESDVKNQTANTLLTYIESLSKNLSDEEKETSWEGVFTSLSKADKNTICSKIISKYNLISDYNDYKNEVQAISDYFYILQTQNLDAYNYLFVNAEKNSPNEKIIQANDLISNYIICKNTVLELQKQIKDIEDKLNDPNAHYTDKQKEDYKKQKQDLQDKIIEAEKTLNNSLSENAKNNNWLQKIKDNEDLIDKDWFNFFIADEKLLFIFLQSDYGYSYIDEAKDSLKKDSYKAYLEKIVKLNELSFSYVDMLDGDVQTWIDSIKDPLTNEEKEILLNTLSGTGAITTYWNYGTIQDQILNEYGASTFVNNNIIEYNNKFNQIIVQKYNEKYDEYLKLQSKNSLLNSAYSALVSNNVSWAGELRSNDVTAADFLDEDANNAIKKWVTNNNTVQTLLNEKYNDNQRHLMWLYSNSASYDLNVDGTIPGAEQSFINLLNSAYAKLNSKVDTTGLINEICTVNNSLKESKEAREAVQVRLNALSTEVTNQNNKYNQSITEWKNSIEALKEATDAYNQKVETADSQFATLKQKEHAKRIAQEKYDYATSIYLKELGQINNVNYISPEEKLVNITYSKQQAQITVDVLEELKTGYEQNSEYSTAMTEYKNAVMNHYKTQLIKKESDVAISLQKDNVRKADQEVQEAYSKIIMNPVSMKNVTPNMKLVCITKNADNTFSFSLATNGRTCNEALMLEYFTKQEVAEKIVGGERNITHAVYDTREWVERINKDRSYSEKLMLAAVYVKYINGTISLDEFSCNELPQDTIQGINCLEISKQYREEIFAEAYNDVMGMNGGESDLARYLIYVQDNSGVNGGNNKYGTTNLFNSQLNDVYKIRLLNKMINYCEPLHDNYVVESIAMFAEAAAWGAIAACCPWPANLIPAAVAAGFSIAGGTALYKANVIKNDLMTYMSGKVSTLQKNVSSSVKAETEYFTDITNAKENLKTEWSRLNKMLNGVDSEISPAPTVDLVQNAMKERVSILSNKETYTSDINSLYTKEVFDKSGAGAAETVAEAIDIINLWYETQETIKEENLAHVVTKLQNTQKEKALDFTTEVNANTSLSEEQQKELHKLANKASDEKLSAEERAQAKKDFEELSKKYLAVNKTYKDNLKELAKAAYGKGTWHSDVYYKDQVDLAKSLYSDSRINFSNGTESYTHEALTKYKKMILDSFDQAVKAQMEVYEANQNKERNQLNTKRLAWENQMLLISNLAEVEWNKAGESLTSGYNEWKKKFIKEYNEKQLAWKNNYNTFIEQKQNWVNEQFLYAVNMGNAEVLDNSGLDVEAAIAQCLAQVTVDSMSLKVIDADKYTDELIANSSLSKLMNSVESLKDRGKNAAITKKHGSKKNATATEALYNAQIVMKEMEKALENAAARLAGEQAALLVEKSIEASMSRIDQENKAMRDWEISLVQANGYTVDDKTIERDAVIDSTIAGAIYSHQTVAFYEDFTTSKPNLTVSLSKTMLEGLDSSAIMLLVSQANDEIEDWNTSIFGETTVDEEGNTVQKQYVVPKTAAKSIHSSKNKNYDAQYKSNENAAEKKEYDALVKKGYAYLDSTEKDRFEELSSKLVTVRDGELGEWIGYAPQFKDSRDNNGVKDKDNEDLSLKVEDGRDANVKFYGEGQMGKIMLDFQWNSILEGQGWGKLAQPMYDQALWYAPDSWFQPPTLRSVTNIVFEIVGTATGQKWFTYADEVIFAAIDIGGGYKSAEEVGLQLAKTAATAAISYGCSAAGSAISSTVSTAMEGASKFANFAAQAGISFAQSYVTTVANSAVNSVQFDEDGNLTFDSKGFKKSLYSADTIAGAAGAGMTAGLNKVLDMNYKAQGKDGAEMAKLGKGITSLGIATASKLTEWSVYSAYALSEGRDVFDAFDDMGGYTFNIANIGIIADLIATKEGRTNATGQSGTWGKIADHLSGTGILEINFTNKKITGQFGMGGFDIAGAAYDTVKTLKDYIALEEYASQMGITPEEAAALNDAYTFGDRTQADAAMRIVNGTDTLKIVDEIEGADEKTFGYTTQKEDGSGRVIQLKRDTENNNALHLGHEAYRNGIKQDEKEQDAETFNAVVAHAGMGARMEDYNVEFTGRSAVENADYRNGNIFGLMLSTMMNYDSSDDFWKLLDNGSLAYDGHATLRDSKGNIIRRWKDMKGVSSDDAVESALISILGLDKNNKEHVEKVQKMMSLVMIHSYDPDPNNWYWKTDKTAVYQDGVLGNGYPRIKSAKVTDYNMDKEISLDMILDMYDDLFQDPQKDKAASMKAINSFIKTVYNSPITMLNMTDKTANATATSYMLNKVYTEQQMGWIKYNQIWYNGVINNSQDIRSSMFKNKAKQSQGFGKQSEKIKLATTSVENAASLVEDHPGYDHGGAEKDSVVYTPGGYWQFLGQGKDTSNHTSSWTLYGSDLNMRIMHIKPSNITQTANTVYGSKDGDYKLFDYPTESYGSGSGAHTHVEFTRLLPHDGYAYVSQYVDPNTFQPTDKFEYNIYYYDKDDKLIKTTPYNRNFGRDNIYYNGRDW